MKMYQINEEDLSILEDVLPKLMNLNILSCNDPIVRRNWEVTKSILSNVRWGYGPPKKVEEYDQ